MELTPQQWQQVAVFIGTIIVTIYLTYRSRQNEKSGYAEKQVASQASNGSGNGNGLVLRVIATGYEGIQDDIRELRKDMRMVKEDVAAFRRMEAERNTAFRLEMAQEVGKIVTDRMRLELKERDQRLLDINAEIEKLKGRNAA